MRARKAIVGISAAILALSFVLGAAQGAVAAPAATTSHASPSPELSRISAQFERGAFPVQGIAAKSTKTLCSDLSIDASSDWTYSKGYAYVEDWYTGDITLCGKGVDVLVATPPSGYSNDGYYGMAGVVVSGQLDLILLSFDVQGGWYCFDASASGCLGGSAGFTFPSSFCSSEPNGYCNPDGVVVKSNLVFTYVDVVNIELVTCSAYASSCANDPASSAFAGYTPLGITQKGTKLYVTDNSCTGNIWEGTTAKMHVLYTEGNSLEAISFHGKLLYVGDDAICGGNAGILNAKTGVELATPLSGAYEINGLDTDLQWTVPFAYEVLSS